MPLVGVAPWGQIASEKPRPFQHQWRLCGTVVEALSQSLMFVPFSWQLIEWNLASAVSWLRSLLLAVLSTPLWYRASEVRQPLTFLTEVQIASEKPRPFQHQWRLCGTVVEALSQSLMFVPFSWQLIEWNLASAVSWLRSLLLAVLSTPLWYRASEVRQPLTFLIEVVRSMSSPRSSPSWYVGLVVCSYLVLIGVS